MSAVSLSNPLRPVLLAAARSSRLEKTVSGMTLTRKLVDRFVAGDAEPAAMSAVRDILTSGRFVTVDYLGEDTTDPAQATATVDAYLSLLPLVRNAFRDCRDATLPGGFAQALRVGAVTSR